MALQNFKTRFLNFAWLPFSNKVTPIIDSSNTDFTKTYQLSPILINTAYYSGVIPFYWDARQCKYKFTTSKWQLLRWKFTIIFSMIFYLFVMFGFFQTAQKYNFDMQNHSILAIHMLISAMAVNSMLLHINTFFKANEIVAFFNNWTEFYKKFEGRVKCLNVKFFSVIKFLNIFVNFLLQGNIPQLKTTWEIRKNRTQYTLTTYAHNCYCYSTVSIMDAFSLHCSI